MSAVQGDGQDAGMQVIHPTTESTNPDLPASVRDRLERLAPDQRAAAIAPPGPVLCVAPAGSGKTTTLVARICWRIAMGVDPRTVCAVTFNRRAAEELRERLDVALEPQGVPRGTVRVRTFHALGRQILRDSGVDVTRLAERATVIERLAGEQLPAATMRLLDDAFTRLTLDPERGPTPDQVHIHAAYAAYRAALEADTMIDMDDLVAGALRVLRDDVGALATWRARTQVLLVDESQDLDRTQLELALLLAGDARDIFLVGDDDQTIYAWRLADVRRILDLAARLPGLRRVDLTTNYRCPPEVVRRAARLVEHVTERFVKRIDAAPRATGSLVLAPDSGDDVARARRLLIAWYGRDPGGYAILARTNSQLAPYAAVAIERGIPFRVEQDGLALDDPTIDDLLDRVAHDGRDRDPLLLRITAAMGSGQVTESGDDIGRVVLGWAATCATLESLRSAIARARGARSVLRDGPGALILATAHGTKGLEFDHVAVVGMDDGVFPSDRSVSEAPDPVRALDEERRLAYVAWTRAKVELVLVYDPDAPSIFMREAFSADELRPP